MAADKEKTVTRSTSEYNKLFRSILLAVALFSVVSFPESLTAQPDGESVARLHYRLASGSRSLFDGYQSYVSGSFSPYQSHRSGEKRDSAFVARTNGGEVMIEWNTASVPLQWKGDSASFIWTCGFGNNLGSEWFDLAVNDSDIVAFPTINDGFWELTGKKGFRLSFTAVAQNSYGANLGYMMLTVHSSFVTKGKPLKLRIRGREAKDEIWYRMYPYRNIATHVKQRELQSNYSAIDFIHMGDAILTMCTAPKFNNAAVQLWTKKNLTAEGRMQSDGTISKIVITIPRSRQPGGSSHTIITIAGKTVDTLFWSEIEQKRIRAFMDEQIVFSRYVFPPGEFPGYRWKNELLVEQMIGNVQLSVRFFNNAFQHVTRADAPGRYGAVIEGKTADGVSIQRFVTLYCAPVEFDDYSNEIPVIVNALKGYGIGEEEWQQYHSQKERYSFGSLKVFPQHDPDAAIFLAGLKDLNDSEYSYDTPRIRDRQWWITLKSTLSASPALKVTVALPKKTASTPKVIQTDSVFVSSYHDNNRIGKLRDVCRNWAATGGVPHVTLIVHRGKIIFHEAFGSDESGKPITTASIQWMASITKLLTGVLMMQYVQQGIVDLDAPISKYLPEIIESGATPLTLRHLFTHTSGLQFAGEWASDWNVSLENQIAMLMPFVTVEETFSYNRVGYAVAGKILERLTGRAVPYLFQQQIFGPLGMTTAYSDNTYGGLYCSALDLAKFGQMLLNNGIYNGWTLFSSGTFKKMLPAPLPVSDRRWGIGTTPLGGSGLSDETFGHEAASGSVIRIDPKNELIIISARNRSGRQHKEYEKKFIEQCVELIKKN
jgi:CubicO group peptidase (beta-lactamase class C family)